MFIIIESSQADKTLKKVPREVLLRYEKWKDVIHFSGPEGLLDIKGFHDEKLQGIWEGHRSSRLGIKWRVIYKMNREQLIIKVVRITAHDYR